MAAGVTYEPLATTTLTSAASTITFSSISGSYTDLSIVLVATNDSTEASDYVRIRLNSDTGSNYSRTELDGDGSATQSLRSTNSPYFVTLGLNTLGTTPSLTIINIFSYAENTFKTMLASTSYDRNGSGATGVGIGMWRNTSAVTQIDIGQFNLKNFKAGTTATLYGILKA